MYLALRLMRKIDTTTGDRISLENPDQRCLGMIAVFETKTAAREVYGRDVELLKIEIQEPDS